PATTLDQLSGGRMLLGLGVSGPQVVEGWHGVAYGKPLVRTREYVEIVRGIWAREKPLEHQGPHYQIPYRGPDASGLGKPLKSIVHGRQIPIYLAAIGPKRVAQCAEIADGWLPIFYSPYRAPKTYQAPLDGGLRPAGEVGRGGGGVGDEEGRGGGGAAYDKAAARALHRRHGRPREELLQRPRVPLRLRGGREEDPGPLPRRTQGRGDGRRSRRAGR